MELEKYSIGVGDRFDHEAKAQLRAVQRAADEGIRIVPVWNKSHREHTLARTVPEATRREADNAVRLCGWRDSYYLDADHIGLANVDPFIPFCNFFTIEAADYVGKSRILNLEVTTWSSHISNDNVTTSTFDIRFSFTPSLYPTRA